MTQYAVIIEEENGAFGAYVPDLPGCVAAGESRDEVERLITEAISLHLEMMRKRGEAVPEAATSTLAVEVST